MKRNLFLLFTLIIAAAITWKVVALPGKKEPTTADIVLTVEDESTEAEASEEEPAAEEKEILATLQQLFDGFGDSSSYSYARFLYNYKDPADSTANMSNTEMSYCVKRDSMFYETDDIVIANTNTAYVNVLKEQKRIVVAPSKTSGELPEMPLKKVAKFYRSNGYTMEKTQTDSAVARIRIYNANHLNCKEMIIDYNPVTMKPVAVKYVLTDIDDPFNDRMDKIMRLQITEWTRDEEEVKSKFFPATVQMQGEKIIPAAAYKQFGMINLLSE